MNPAYLIAMQRKNIQLHESIEQGLKEYKFMVDCLAKLELVG